MTRPGLTRPSPPARCRKRDITDYAMDYWWSTIALCWFLKLLLVRYGGLKAYVHARPLFLGLILGDAVVACVLALLSWLFGWHGISRY